MNAPSFPGRAFSGVARRFGLLLARWTVALGGLVYGLTLGMRKARHRALVAQVASHFGFRGVSPGQLRRVTIESVTGPSTPVVLPVARAGDGNVTELELIVLARLVGERRPRAALEIGTFDGRTTVALAANAGGGQVTTLDLPPHSGASLPIESRDVFWIDKAASGTAFADTPWAANIRQVFGDSATYDFAAERFDFVFVDGSHSYEYALSDSRRARDLLRDGRGIIVWHDYGVEWEGVTRALDQLSADPAFHDLVALEGTTLAMLELR
jgi:predicted O-methyltransferase YrrM